MNNLPRCDFHIHSQYIQRPNAIMDFPSIARECERLGLTSFGITEHLNPEFAFEK